MNTLLPEREEPIPAPVQLLCSRSLKTANTSYNQRMKARIKWDTETSGFSRVEMHALGEEIFKFCRNTLGLKPRGGVYPLLMIRPRKKTRNYGEYSPYFHMIEIFSGECENLRRFVDTVIHEYVHSCQPWIGVRYSVYSSKFGYKKNPFEVEANRIARENRTKCIQFLRERFNG